ncbi:uncharacterized protein LOC131436066 [Malaya genurostris]|uniref:uncharacterized protein LOC131436066 n=1 Tax=Malaya genurostris TaxID=325434 RepID=UPI0026F3D250|nr:uncharacterized protein LOC131436066 [Malaya genurostris]
MWIINTLLILVVSFLHPLVVRCQQSSTPVPCNSFFGCISHLECSQDEYWASGVSLNGCCPGCVRGLGLDDVGCDEQNPCAPGLLCGKGGICRINTTNCLATKHVPQHVQWKPTCDSRGQFLPKQCRGDELLGRCFCYSATGRRIFGWDWMDKADKMTCACSRNRSDLEANGRTDVTLHCTANGNFEELQCDGGVCWCANPATGEPWPKVPIVLPAMWKKLPCYNRTRHGDQYLRQCESEHFAQKLLQSKFVLHGHRNVSYTDTVCDYDGSYGRYEIERGIAYCTWRDGERIEPFLTSSLKLSSLNCNCARDQKIFTEAGLEMVLLCEGNGNYRTLQDRNGELFCVDRDGFEVATQQKVTSEEECYQYMFL